MTRYGMVIDLTLCTGCNTCVVACQLGNSLHPGISWLQVDTVERGRWPNADRFSFPHACMNCLEPRCVQVCPTGASHKRDDGTVGIDAATCIGCSVCVAACEYGARTINKDTRWYFDASGPAPYEEAARDRLGIAEKCTFCHDRITQGEAPFCVKGCVNKARTFGDVDNAQSEISIIIEGGSTQQISGTAMYYIIGEHEFDLQPYAKSIARRSAEEKETSQVDEPPKGNPRVVVVAGAAAIATTAGLGYAAKRNGDKRKRKQDELANGEGRR